MKKKVRIYKSPDGKGRFVNKTAKFLRKAQEGGEQDKQAQLADYVYKTLDDAEPFEFESIKESLINELASAQIPIDQAEGMVENIAASLSNETAEADELAGQEETTVDDQAQEELRAQEEAAAAAEEERQAGLAQDYGYYDDTAAQGEDEEDEEDYDDEEEASYMQMGGDLIPEPNAVSFTGYDPEQYAQDSMNSFSKGGITKRKYIGSVMKMLKKQDGGEGEKDSQMDPMDTASNEKKRKKDAFIGALASSAQEAKMKEKAEAMWEQEQQAMMQQQAPQYPMQAPMEQVPMAQRGLSINHGGHIGQGLGDKDNPYIISGCFGRPGEDCGPEDETIGGGDITFGATEEQKQEWKNNKWPSNYPEVSPRQMRRMMPRGFGRGQMRSFAGMVPQGGMFPMGMNIMTYPQMMPEQKPIHVQGTPQGMKLDVRKSNWLTGRPSQYSIEFGGDSAIPGFNMMPGMGYGAKSKQRKTIEGVSRLVNKNADPSKNQESVILNTTESKKVADPNIASTDKDMKPVLDASGNQIVSDGSNMTFNSSDPMTETKTSSTTTNPNKDAVGNGSKLPTKSATAKTNTANASKNAGQTKIPKSAGSNTEVGKGTVLKAPITNKAVLKSAPVTKTVVKKVQSKSLPVDNSSWTDNFATSWDEVGQNALNFGNRLKDGWNANVEMASDLGERVKDGWNSNWGAWTGLQFEQDGGFVDSSNPDLYKFVYGGNEQFLDPITQQDMDYADSKNTASPYFANGGYVKYQDKGEVKEDDYDKYQREKAEKEATDEYNAYMNRGEGDKSKMVAYKANTNDAIYNKILEQSRKKYNLVDPNEKPKTEEKKTEVTEDDDDSGDQNYNDYGNNRGYTGYPQNAFNRYFPANTIRNLGTYSQQMGMPYGADGSAYTGGFGPNTNLTKIDVRKSGWLSGKPRKYTMHFNNYSIDPALSKYLDETEGSGSQSKASNSGDGSANIEQPNSDGIYPSNGTSFPSAEEIASRDAATLANKDVVREFSDVEGVQNDPFGFGSGGVDETPTDFEESIRTYDSPEAANEYVQGEWGDIMTDVSEVLGPESQQEFDKFLATNPTKGAIDAKIESFMGKRNEAIGKDESAVERNELTADPEEEMLNQQAMQRNPMFMGNSGASAANSNFGADPMIATGSGEDLSSNQEDPTNYQDYGYGYGAPGFGDDMMGAPSIGGVSPWSIPGFDAMSDELSSRSGAAPNAENLPVLNQGDGSDTFGYDVKSKQQIQEEQKLQQQQQAIKQQQIQAQKIQAQKIQAQKIQAQKSGQNQSGSQGSNANAATLAKKAQNSNRQTVRNAGNDFNIRGVIDGAGGDLSGFKDSAIGAKTMYAIDKRWENMSKAQKKNYGNYKNYLRVERYDKFVNVMNSKQFGGNSNLNRFVYGDEVTKVSTDTPSPVSNINNPTMSFLKYDDSGQLIIPGFPSPEQDKKKNDMKLSLYEGYGEGDDFSAAPAGSTFTKDEEGNDVVISPDEARKRIKENSFAVDFKNKNAYEVDSKGVIASANAFGNDVFNRMERRGERKANKNFYDRFTADNLYAGDPSRDRGDYEANSGLYRPDEQGQTWNSRSARYGGFMQEGGFVEGDIVDMTQEEIEEFLANGGELEMIS
jgi:hypothetical protein